MSEKTRKSLIGLATVIAIGTISTHAAPITFVWDAPPEASAYRFYASTNGLDTVWPQVKVDTGTNRTVTIDSMTPALWTCWATAYAKGTNYDGSVYTTESDPSKELLLIVPRPPEKMAVVAVQWAGTLASTNWTDMGFFRLKIGVP